MKGTFTLRKPIDVLKKGYIYLLSRPKIVIPFMIYEAGVIVGQSVLVIAFLTLLSYFKAFNLIPKIIEEITKENYRYLLQPEILHPVLITFSITAAVYVLVVLIFDSFVKAGLYPYLQRILIEGNGGLKLFLGYAFQRWKLVLKTNLLMYSIILLPLLPSAILLYFGVSEVITLNKLNEVFLKFSAMMFVIGLFCALILYLLLIFAPITAAIDLDSPFSNIVKSLKIAKREIGAVILYFSSLLAITFLIIVVESIVEIFYVTIGSLIALIISLAIMPILNMYLVAVYEYYHNENLAMIGRKKVNIDYVYKVFKRAYKHVKTFLKSKEGLISVLIVTFFFIVGFILGLITISPDVRDVIINSGVIVPGEINPQFKIYNRIFLGLDIFFHNWRTSLATAMAGIAYSIPSAISILFNGYVVGIVYATIANPIKASAIILPHGIIEIPAFLIASASGVHLGVTMLRYVKGKETLDVLEKELTNVAILIIGLSLLFFIAGIIEGNVTPVIAELAGWR